MDIHQVNMASMEEVSHFLSKEMKVAAQSCQSAESYFQKKNYGRAFAHYLLVLKLAPSKKADIKDHFTVALKEWGKQLEDNGRIEDLFKCFDQACELFPDCDTMLNNMGSQLFRLGYPDEAASCFRKAIKINPTFLGAKENLENACSHLVERWHFRMLNDLNRNCCYERAIRIAIYQGFDTVLDIGSGTGLLSMFASQTGAKSVYACEMSKAMYELSCDVLATNKEENIKLMHSASTDLKVPENIPQKVSLVVTETFDCGLVGEHVLTTLAHAWKELLINDPTNGTKGKVIPEEAKVYMCAIECEYIRNRNRFLYPGLKGLDLSDVEIVGPSSDDPGWGIGETDPYTTEFLNQVPGGYRKLSAVEHVYNFDFNDPEKIQKYVDGVRRRWNVDIVQNGRLDAIAVWFDLHLDERTIVSTDPNVKGCWEQAIYPVLPSHLQGQRNDNLYVRDKDSLVVTFGCYDDALHFRCINISRLVKEQRQLRVSLGANRSNQDKKFIEHIRDELIKGGQWYSNQETSSGYFHLPKIDIPPHRVPKAQVKSKDQSNMLGVFHDGKVNGLPETSNIACFQYANGAYCYNGPDPCPFSTPYAHNVPDFPDGTYTQHSEEKLTVAKTFGGVKPKSSSPAYDIGLSHFWPMNLGSYSDIFEGTLRENGSPCAAADFNRWCDSSQQFDFSSTSTQDMPRAKYHLEQEDIIKLNDLHLDRSYCCAMEHVKDSLPSKPKVLTISQGVPILPLHLLNIGVAQVGMTGNSCDPHNWSLLEDIGMLNQLDCKKVSRVGLDEDNEPDYDMCVVELVEPAGCLEQRVLDDIALARMTCLKDGAVIIPGEASVYAMVIESQTILENSALVSDDRTLDLQISQHINDFVMTTHQDINLQSLEYKKLSPPVEIFSFNFNEAHKGKLPPYLEQETTVESTAIDCGEATAVVYWFHLHLTPKIKVSTLDVKHHWNQAAVLVRPGLPVSSGTQLKLHARCQNSCIDIKVEAS